MSEGEQLIRVDEVTEGVARIRIDRPEKRNAMSRAARRQLLAALGEVRSLEARAVILTGTETAFCAGIDLKERRTNGPQGIRARGTGVVDDTWNAVQDAIRLHPAIFIAAVNGFALGGGVTLINSCDLAIAADEARIGMPEIGLGTYPGLAGPSTQLRLLRKRAAWMVLTAEQIDGKTAAEWGLVNLSVPLVQLQAEADKLAGRIASFDPVALAWSKRALWEVPSHLSDWTAALEFGGYIGNQIRTENRGDPSGMDAFAGSDEARQ